jgi:hypothetical protein
LVVVVVGAAVVVELEPVLVEVELVAAEVELVEGDPVELVAAGDMVVLVDGEPA